MADQTVQEPPDTYGLWHQVRAGTRWPSADEGQMADLGSAWTEAGRPFATAGAPSTDDDAITTAWPDPAGYSFHDHVTGLRTTMLGLGQHMAQLGSLATEYGKDVADAKQQIVDLIMQSIPVYAQLRTWYGTPDVEQQQQMVARLTREINTFLDQMAERIKARGAGAAPIARPTLHGISRTKGVSLHGSIGALGAGITGSIGIADVNGTPTLMWSWGTFHTTDPTPAAQGTVGLIDSNATEPDQLTHTSTTVGGSTSVGPSVPLGDLPVTATPMAGTDVSSGHDPQGNSVTVQEPQIGVTVAPGGPRVDAPVPAHVGGDHGPLPIPVGERPPDEIPGEVHTESTQTQVWTPFN